MSALSVALLSGSDPLRTLDVGYCLTPDGRLKDGMAGEIKRRLQVSIADTKNISSMTDFRMVFMSSPDEKRFELSLDQWVGLTESGLFQDFLIDTLSTWVVNQKTLDIALMSMDCPLLVTPDYIKKYALDPALTVDCSVAFGDAQLRLYIDPDIGTGQGAVLFECGSPTALVLDGVALYSLAACDSNTVLQEELCRLLSNIAHRAKREGKMASFLESLPEDIQNVLLECPYDQEEALHQDIRGIVETLKLKGISTARRKSEGLSL